MADTFFTSDPAAAVNSPASLIRAVFSLRPAADLTVQTSDAPALRPAASAISRSRLATITVLMPMVLIMVMASGALGSIYSSKETTALSFPSSAMIMGFLPIRFIISQCIRASFHVFSSPVCPFMSDGDTRVYSFSPLFSTIFVFFPRGVLSPMRFLISFSPGPEKDKMSAILYSPVPI